MGLLQWLGFGRTTTQNGVLSPLITSNHLEQVTWADLLGVDSDTTPVSRADAMALPPIAKGRHLLCGQAGRLTWTGLRGRSVLADQPQILRQPEKGRPRTLTMAWTVDALFFFGRAWWLVTERLATGKPNHVAWIPEYAISVDRHSGQILVNNRSVSPDDVIRIDGPHEGILTLGARPLRAARSMHRAVTRAADNPVPVVELHQVQGEPMKQSEITTLINDWITARRNPNGAVGFTSKNVETRIHGNPVEQLLIEGRKAAALEAAQLAGLPAWAVDAETGGSSLTYSNVPSRTRELVEYSLMPYLDAIAGRLSMDDILPAGTWARPDVQALTQPDFADRMAGYQAAVNAGIYTVAELRELELTGQITTPATEPAEEPTP